MIRVSIAAAALALLAATNPGTAQNYGSSYNNSYNSYNSYSKPSYYSRYGYNSHNNSWSRPGYGYQNPSDAPFNSPNSYRRYGYGYRN